MNTPEREAGISGLERLYHQSPARQPAGRFFVMSAKDGKPCKKCGTSEWYKDGHCVVCSRDRLRVWKAENPQKDAEYNRRRRADNPEKTREHKRRWAVANSDKERARYNRYRTAKTEAGGSYTDTEWKALVEYQNGRCLACGKKAKLTADHIVPVSKGGSSDISNIQGLCRPCNSSKGNKTIDHRKDGGFLRWIQKRLWD